MDIGMGSTREKCRESSTSEFCLELEPFGRAEPGTKHGL